MARGKVTSPEGDVRNVECASYSEMETKAVEEDVVSAFVLGGDEASAAAGGA